MIKFRAIFYHNNQFISIKGNKKNTPVYALGNFHKIIFSYS